MNIRFPLTQLATPLHPDHRLEYFDDYNPAMSLFEVESLYRRDALVVCEGIAVIEPHETS